MPYDERLADRIRRLIGKRNGFVEKKMFGGLAFLLDGRMCCGLIKNDLVIRVGPEKYEKALTEPNARPMDFTGRPIKGFVFVSSDGYETDSALAKWLDLAVDFVSTLPEKKSKAAKASVRPA